MLTFSLRFDKNALYQKNNKAKTGISSASIPVIRKPAVSCEPVQIEG